MIFLVGDAGRHDRRRRPLAVAVAALSAWQARTVQHVLAIDIGGTKMAAAVVDADGELVAQDRVPTEGVDAEVLLSVVTDLAGRVLHRAGAEVSGCGVGAGGPMTRGGEWLSPLNIAQWRDFPLRRRLADHLGVDTWVDNDAKALALAEGWRGGAVGCADHLAMVVSTGVGGGIVLDGRLLDGAGGNAGHIGHVNVVPGGRRCSCGARGCPEAEASGTAIAAITGRPAVEADDEIRRRTGELVGRAVGSTTALLDLRRVSVAGSVALGFGDVFFDAAAESMARHATISHAQGATIGPAALGADGPLVGAAAVAWRGLGRDVGAQ